MVVRLYISRFLSIEINSDENLMFALLIVKFSFIYKIHLVCISVSFESVMVKVVLRKKIYDIRYKYFLTNTLPVCLISVVSYKCTPVRSLDPMNFGSYQWDLTSEVGFLVIMQPDYCLLPHFQYHLRHFISESDIFHDAFLEY